MDTEQILSHDRQFYSVSDLLAAGLTYYKINKLVSDGKLAKLNNKMYENKTYQGETSDFAFVNAYAPKAVICMMSAARYYGLTTYLPDAVDIAIERDMKISTLPEWPKVNIWFFPMKRYSAGVAEGNDEACRFSVYDMEKTVADILYYRNKVGIQEAGEVLKNYLRREDRDLAKLHRYADSLGSGKILSTYLEVLL